MCKQLCPILFLAVVIASCSAKNTGGTNGGVNDSAGVPVETKPPNTDYKPAFTGQTRISGVTTKTPYEGKNISTYTDIFYKFIYFLLS